MYVSPIELAVWWIAFSLVVVPREHRSGWRRVFAGFVIGHVGATVSTAALQMWEAQAFPNPDLIPERIDVGASYGFCALAALATYRGSLRRRLLWAGGLVGLLAAGLLLDLDWSSIGHCVAALIGFAAYPLVRPEAAVHHEARVRARRLYQMEHCEPGPRQVIDGFCDLPQPVLACIQNNRARGCWPRVNPPRATARE